MFSKIVAIEPVSLIPSAEEALHTFANEVVMYPDIPADDEEIVRRIGDADAVLLSYTSSIRREVMERCPNIKYIGMCCSLFSPESANVDNHLTNGSSSQAGDSPVLNSIFLSPNFRNSASCSRTVFLFRQQKTASLCSSSWSKGRKRYPFSRAHSFSLRAK